MSRIVFQESTLVSGAGVTVLGPYDAPGDSLAVYLDVTTQAGTTPTLDIDIEAVCPVSGQYYTLASFTQIGGATGKEREPVTPLPDGKVQCRVTLGGTSPAYTFSLIGVTDA